jgi:penicillin-binding protein 1C
VPPAGCELRQVCSVTGLPPGPRCTNLISDYFFPLVSSTQVCGHLQEIKVSPDSAVSYCEGCAPPTGYSKKLYSVSAPELQEYFAATNTPYQTIPTHNPACERVFKGEGPNIIFPHNGAEYFIDKLAPEPLQLMASVPADVSKLYWYVNDRFYKTANRGEKQFFVPEEGPVKISCSDDKGRSKTIRIVVKRVSL